MSNTDKEKNESPQNKPCDLDKLSLNELLKLYILRFNRNKTLPFIDENKNS